MLVIFLISHLSIFCQTIGVYEFTGIGTCPNPYTLVTTQPQNASFSLYSSTGVNCSSTNDVYNNSSWNTSNVINLNEYNEFSLVPDSCYSLTITGFTFSHRVSNINTIPIWYLRSSIDNFSSDLGSGTSSTSISSSTINLPSNFTNLSSLTFRLYLTSVYASSTTWRNDNVSVSGTINSIIPQLFYADLDADTFGNPDSTILACSIPLGFVENDLDCNDTNSQIHPYTIWYQDADLDNYGNENEQYIGCDPPFSYVLNSNDCDDQNELITIASNLFYQDNDNDGYGNSDISLVACNSPLGYVSNGADCDDSNAVISFATQIYYLDEDGDGYGNEVLSQTSCSQPNGYVSNQLDCDDTDQFVFPNASDVFGNSVDENCDGVDGCLGINEEDILSSIILIYPNPSNGVFTIISSQNSIIKLRDIQGKEIAERTNSPQIDFSNFSDGIYLIEITTDKGSYNKMITINH